MNCIKICYQLCVIAAVILSSDIVQASAFISAGSGFSAAAADSGDETAAISVPFNLGFQYSSGYRESFLLSAMINWTLIPGKDKTDGLFIASMGLMYISPFTIYRSNITETTLRRESCIGFLFLPFTAVRDSITNVVQYFIPQSPVFYIGPALIGESRTALRNGISAGAGLTSGGLDILMRYTQGIRYDEGFKRDIYAASVEFSINIPLQNRFVRTEKLIE